MKKAYCKPKAMVVDFCYDEQVTAASGNVATYGDPYHIGKCQQSSDTSCVHFWLDRKFCVADPLSLSGGKSVVG